MGLRGSTGSILTTSFTELVGDELPIQSAPMGGVSSPALIGAVVGAGGMGMASMPIAPAEAVVGLLEGIAAEVDGPVGFNVLMPFLDVAAVEAAAEHCRYVDFYHGPVDASLVDRVHRAGPSPAGRSARARRLARPRTRAATSWWPGEPRAAGACTAPAASGRC